MRRSLMLSALLALAMSAPARAQTALVLSGGGARGLSHAGVVAALDSLGIQPSIVTGASMGAIIGALYATGRDPAEIRRLMERRDWMALFAPRPAYVGPDGAPLLPLLRWPLAAARPGVQQGLVPDGGINRELVRLLFDSQVRIRGDFDRLPRRYRLVATDLSTGRAVEMGDGDLARLVRASMAVPGVFAPVPWQGRWLVDGGISDYLPVATARAMGADTVIAVDVIRPAPDLEGLDMVDMAARALRLLIVNTDREAPPADYVIRPAIPQGMSGASFPRDAGLLIQLGAEATRATLRPAAPAAPPPPPLPAPPAGFSDLDVDAPEPGIARVVRSAMAAASAGAYDPGAVLAAVDVVYATGLADAVWPYAAPNPADPERPRLRVDVVPPPATVLLAAAGYDTDRGARAWAGVRRRMATPTPLELAAAASVQDLEQWASVSARAVVPAIPRVDLQAGAYVRETDVREFDADGGIAGERAVTRTGARLGVGYRRVSPSMRGLLEARAEHVREDDGRVGFAWGPRLLLAGDGPDLAPVGVPALLELEARAGAFHYGRARARGSIRGRAGPVRLAAVASAEWVGDLPWPEDVERSDSLAAGPAAGGEAPLDAWPSLGGEAGVPGLRWGELRSPAIAVAGVDFAVPAPFEGFLRFQLRAGAAGDRPGDWGRERWTGGARAGLFWSTPFGPLSAGVGYATTGDWRVDVGVGPDF